MAPVLKYLRISCGIMLLAGIASAQNQSPKLPSQDRADSYYHYSLGHLYAELAGTYGNKGDYFNKAIENYRLAMKEDSSATFIGEELSDLYIQSGRLREAVVEAEDALKKDPGRPECTPSAGAHFTRLIGDRATESH